MRDVDEPSDEGPDASATGMRSAGTVIRAGGQIPPGGVVEGLPGRGQRGGAIEAVEQGFSLTVTSLGVPFVGVVDLVAQLDGQGLLKNL